MTAEHQPDAHPPAGQRYLYWLAEAATQIRTHAGARPETIASMLDVGVETVRRFEKAAHWPRDAERLIAAYAAIGRIDDARDIYQRGLDLWYEHGTRPMLDGEDGTNGLDGDGGAGALPALRARAEPLPPLRPSRTTRPAPENAATTDARRQGQRRKRA